MGKNNRGHCLAWEEKGGRTSSERKKGKGWDKNKPNPKLEARRKGVGGEDGEILKLVLPPR